MAPVSEGKREEVRRAAESFLEAETTTPIDIATMLRSLAHRPKIAPIHDTLPIDEIEERIQLANRATNYDITEWTAIDVAVLMTVLLNNIRSAAETGHDIPLAVIKDFVRLGR